MSWVRVPPEAADFSQKSLPQVSLNCVVFLCVCLEGVLKLFIMYILGLEFGVFGGLITPVCSSILS